LNKLKKSQLTSHPKKRKACTQSIIKALTFNPQKKKKGLTKWGPSLLFCFWRVIRVKEVFELCGCEGIISNLKSYIFSFKNS
jgi:hypothetical protein